MYATVNMPGIPKKRLMTAEDASQLRVFIDTMCLRGDEHILAGECCKQLSVRRFRQAFKKWLNKYVYERDIDEAMTALGFEVVLSHYVQEKLKGVCVYRDRESCVSYRG